MKAVNNLIDFEKVSVGEKVKFGKGAEGVYAGNIEVSFGLPGEQPSFYPLLLERIALDVIYGTYLHVTDYVYLNEFKLAKVVDQKKFNMYKSILEAQA